MASDKLLKTWTHGNIDMDDEQRKIAHLNFVQSIINRMANNSFLIKGWAITLLSALLTVLWDEQDKGYFGIMFIPLGLFWGLDTFYLYYERLYRNLYTKIVINAPGIDLYSMCIDKCKSDDEENIGYNLEDTKIFNIFCSRSIILFYGVITIVISIITFCIKS